MQKEKDQEGLMAEGRAAQGVTGHLARARTGLDKGDPNPRILRGKKGTVRGRGENISSTLAATSMQGGSRRDVVSGCKSTRYKEERTHNCLVPRDL